MISCPVPTTQISNLFLVQTDSGLGLVKNALAGAAVLVAVVAAADLVANLLAGGL